MKKPISFLLKSTYLFILFLLLVTVEVSGQVNIHADTSDFGNMMDIKTYRNKKLINHVVKDSAGKLMYQAPLLPAQKVPAFKFISGRTYYEKGKTDTIVFEHNIPQMNLNVYFPGGTVRRTNMYTYIIMEWRPQPGTQKGKMVIDVFENVFENEKSKRVNHKVVLMDIR